MFKKYKQLLAGVLIGSIVSGIGVASANGSFVTAQVVDYFKFKFDGNVKSLPEGYTVLMYQDRTYVPARFVADQLGAKVDWDGANNTIVVNTGVSGSTPQKTPVSATSQGVTVTVTSVSVQSDRTVFHLKVTNNGSAPIKIAQSLAQMVVNGQQYNHDSSLNDLSLYDQAWNQDVQAGATQEGFVALPAVPNGSQSASLYLDAMQNGGKYDVLKFNLNTAF